MENDPNALIYIPYPRVNRLKTIPFTAARTYTARIWRYPPATMLCFPRKFTPSWIMLTFTPVNKKSERKSFLEYHHMTYPGKTSPTGQGTDKIYSL